MNTGMNRETFWFYEWKGDRRGPVSEIEVLGLYQTGELSAASLVWREGMDEWVPFSSSDLASKTNSPFSPPAIPAGGPPPVPKSIVSFVPREARLRPGFRPRIRYCIGRGWGMLAANFWPMVGCFALTSLILSVASQFYVPIFFLMYPLMGGLYWYMLLRIRGKEANIDMLFEGFRRQFGPLAIMNLIVAGIGTVLFALIIVAVAVIIALLTAGGAQLEEKLEEPLAIAALIGGSTVFLLLISVPLMVLGQVANFASLLILDCSLTAKESLSLAWRATRAFLFKFFLFMMLNTFLSMIGIFALYFGMFITGAWATLALVYLYEDAFGDEAPEDGASPVGG